MDHNPWFEYHPNTIIFPQQGPRPHPDGVPCKNFFIILELAGGDLDGDKFWVCWEKSLIPTPSNARVDYGLYTGENGTNFSLFSRDFPAHEHGWQFEQVKQMANEFVENWKNPMKLISSWHTSTYFDLMKTIYYFF